MTPSDHYRVLGVPRFAAPAAVRRAYVTQLKGHHGGATPLSDERLRRIGVAYWELRHPDRRAAYDATLRERERRRTAGGRPVMKRSAPRVQLPPPRSRPGTRWVFAASLALLAGGIAWALERRPTLVIAPAPVREAQVPALAMIDEALLDYRVIMASGGQGQLERLVRQCFADMRASAPAAVFDYCVALDGLAAAELGSRSGFFSEGERRSRLAGVAFGPAAAERWVAVNRLVATR